MSKWKPNHLAGVAVIVSLTALLLSWRNDRPPTRESSAAESRSAGPRQGATATDRPMPKLVQSQDNRTERLKKMLKQIAHTLPVTEEEQKRVDAATARKLEVRRPLEEQRMKVAEMALEKKSSDEQIQSALDELLTLKQKTDEQVEEIDRELIANVSMRARANLYASGLVGNGLVIKAQIESTGPSPEMMERMRAMMTGANRNSTPPFPTRLPHPPGPGTASPLHDR